MTPHSWLIACGLAAAAAALGASAQTASFETRSLTPEAALTAARAALEHCRKGGFQVCLPGDQEA